MALTGDALAAAVQTNGQPVVQVLYTADSDPNKLLGRPGQYVAKINWWDRRVGVGEPQPSATIEVFADDASLKARQEYTTAISNSSPLFLHYIYVNQARRALMRLPKALTPDQPKAYETWFAALR